MAWGGSRRGSGRKPAGASNDETAKAGPLAAVKALALRITDTVLARSRFRPRQQRDENPPAVNVFQPLHHLHPPGVSAGVASGGLAMDEDIQANIAWASNALSQVWTQGLTFLGYSSLSELAQRPEYRAISEIIASEMTRKWIRLQASGDDDKTEQIKQLTDEMERLNIRDIFREAAEQDGFFGRSHIYLDLGTTEDREELKTLIGDGSNDISRAKVGRGALKRMKSVEAVWCYPTDYNSNDPLRADWYKPSSWFVMGKQIHASRLLTFVGREVPDLLKPAYSFGGLSMSQMAKPYVDNWLRTRQSVADLIRSFSVSGILTDLNVTLQAGGDAIERRADFFNNMRDNRGMMLLNKDTEEFFNINTPLGTLDALQAQTQEHMCLQAGVKIETARGQVPVEEVTNKDLVLTRDGFSPIKWVGVTGHADTLIEIEAGGSILRVTEEHPIWSESENDFVNARNVSRSHRLLALDSMVNTANQFHGAADGGGKPSVATTAIRRQADSFIVSCGQRIEALFLTVTKFITETVMGRTMVGTTLNLSPAQSTWSGMVESALSKNASTQKNARSVLPTSWPQMRRRSIVQEHAINEPIIAATRARSIADHAKTAARSLSLSGNEQLVSVLTHVYSVPVTRVTGIKVPRQPVYNIEVDGPPEFFANGILVHNSAVSRIPLVKLLGIQPAGLNATGDSEIRTFYDWIGAYQRLLFGANLKRVMGFVQLSLWGQVDPAITFEFEPLWSLDEAQQAAARKTDAETGQIHIDSGVISPEEERQRIAGDPDTLYPGLDPNDVPEPLEPDPLDGGGGEFGSGGETVNEPKDGSAE